MIVTGIDLDVNASRSTWTDDGRSMISMLGSVLVIVIGMEYVPARFTAAQSTLTVNTVGLSVLSVFWSPPTRTRTLLTGWTSTYPEGTFAALCGTASDTSLVSGGLPAYTTPTHVTNAMKKHSTLSFQLRRMKPGILMGATGA